MIDFVYWAFYALGLAFAVSFLVSVVTAFMGKPSWGQMRVTGVTLALFGWINALFYLAVFEAAFGIISFILNLPSWINIALSILLFGAASVIFIQLSQRATFKPEAFIAVVLVPLSISGVSIIGTAAKEGSLLVSKYGWLVIPKVIAHDIQDIPKFRAKEAPKFPIGKGTFIEKEVPKITKINAPQNLEPTNVRPNWRQSEKDVGQKLGDGYTDQISFKDGKVVPYGTKGSIRPDLYKPEISVEVKNYDVQTDDGQKRLIDNVIQQSIERAKHLPNGTSQSLIIDVRGQQIDRNTLESIVDEITKESGGRILPENIDFLK
jgi:hypothetical protein